MSTLGLDIGGANLKAVYLSSEKADREVQTTNVPFAMWERWKDLSMALRKISQDFDIAEHTRIAVTMTGELADCFACRREGVEFIAGAVEEAFAGREISFYQTDGNWCKRESASDNWKLLAASNWHAMARSAAEFLPNETGLMIDIGSTTTDVIPIVSGQVMAVGKTDFQRLRNHELIYAGVGRTPVCSLIKCVELSGVTIPLSREFFATIDDALIWLNLIPENVVDMNSADGRSRSRANAGRRLARMICSDLDEIDVGVIDSIATTTIAAFESLFVEAVEINIARHQDGIQSVLLLGTGSFLSDRILSERFASLQRISFCDIVEEGCSESGPAYAVAKLAQQRQAI
ncbi:hypothetical protein OAG71_03640 [bacterium]|nr:hypothetical protein [bacterium]